MGRLDRYLMTKNLILMAIKQGKYPPKKCRKYIQNIFKVLNYNILRILDIDPDKKEFHLIAQKQ